MPETEIQIAMDRDFQYIADKDSVAGVIKRYVPRCPLAPGKYHWRIRHVPAGKGPLPWTKPANFTIFQPEKTYHVPVGAGHQKIEQILAWAKNNSPARVIFGKGTWTVYSGSALFELKNHKGLVIDGNGATLRLAGYGSFADIRGSSNIHVHGFNIEYLDPSHIAGKVTAVSSATSSFDLQLLPGYPPLEDVPVIADFPEGTLRKGEGFAIKQQSYGDLETVPGFKNLGNRTYRLQFKKKKGGIKHLQPGDTYIKGPTWEPSIQLIWCNDVCFSNITLYSCPGMGFKSLKANQLRIINVNFLRKDGNPVGIQGDAHRHQDGILGPWIEGCRIENSSYDLCQVNGRAFPVLKVPSKDQVIIAGYPLVRPGDNLVFVDKEKGGVLLRVKALEIGEWSRANLEVKLDATTSGIKGGAGNAAKSKGTIVYNATRQGNEFVWRNNQCSGPLGAGLVCTGKRGLVENNDFEQIGATALKLRGVNIDGLVASDYVIRKNRFKECGLVRRKAPSLGVDAKSWEAGPLMNRNILVEDNEFLEYPNRALLFRHTDGLVVRKNRISNMRFDKFHRKAGVIELENCPGALVEGNEIMDSRPLPEGAVLVKTKEE